MAEVTSIVALLGRDIHRIGGGFIDNLRLTPQEIALEIPGFSVLRAETPEEAALQLMEAFPGATRLLEKARVVGSTTTELIRSAGFDLIPDPTRRFPNHYRVIHHNGLAEFSDKNLSRLAEAFYNAERF